jgi:hypothetical protein
VHEYGRAGAALLAAVDPALEELDPFLGSYRKRPAAAGMASVSGGRLVVAVLARSDEPSLFSAT